MIWLAAGVVGAAAFAAGWYLHTRYNERNNR